VLFADTARQARPRAREAAVGAALRRDLDDRALAGDVTMRIEHWRYSIPLWLRGLLRRQDVERDLDDELRDHIERQTAANIAAGMPPHEARRAALVAFGGLDRIKEESREVRGLAVVDRVAQLRYVARSL